MQDNKKIYYFCAECTRLKDSICQVLIFTFIDLT